MRKGVVVICLVVLTGCASQSGRDGATGVATRFLDAVASADAEAACALLSPRTREDLTTSDGAPCAEVLPTDRLGGTVRDADTWSDQAVVTTDHSTLFLTEFDSGWRVSAAGCEPDGEEPYRCVVGG
jgi:hypothetical protein